ncbi:uncharacterized protein LOC122512007 [Leptopilina heterotoma]|uniref:uncharacterized protein LOC122512007 n=1 Tax=Leptopilina heterotoma TaxID=63436 RepID=UPI001CAA1A17|nr:uncharacterized protein LOC122512007 [Leptopilina heterotoma]
MAGKLSLQIFGIFLCILLGMFHYFQDYNGKSSVITKNRDGITTARFTATTNRKIERQSTTTIRSGIIKPTARKMAQPTNTTARKMAQPTITTARKMAQPTITTARKMAQPKITTARKMAQPKITTARKMAQPTNTTARKMAQPTITTARKMAQPTITTARKMAQPKITTEKIMTQPKITTMPKIMVHNAGSTLKAVNDIPPRDKQFKNDLKTAIKYVDKILNNYKCKYIYKNINDFKKVFDIITAAADNNYIFHTFPNFTVDFNLIQNATLAINHLMPVECERQHLLQNKEIFENILELLHLYDTNFPTQIDSKKYSKCYIHSLLQFESLNEVIKKFDFGKLNTNRNSLNNDIKNQVEKINQCRRLRLTEDDQESKNYRNNSNKNLNQLHEKDKKFKNRLKFFIQYFERIVKDECSEKSETYNDENKNISKIIFYISESATENYYFHINRTAYLGVIPSITIEQLSQFMPKKCEKQLIKDKEILQQLLQLLKIYYENYPRQFINDDEYSECNKKNLMDLINISNDFEKNYFIETYSVDKKVSLSRVLLKKIVSIMKCVELLN